MEMAQRLGRRLRHVHLTDGPGSAKDEHLVPGRGAMDAAVVFSGTWVRRASTATSSSRSTPARQAPAWSARPTCVSPWRLLGSTSSCLCGHRATSSPSMNNLVEIQGLTVDRGKHRVLDGLDLTIEQGGVTGLLGLSGCGKSTLMRSLVGVQVLTSGSVRIDGIESGSQELRHRIGDRPDAGAQRLRRPYGPSTRTSPSSPGCSVATRPPSRRPSNGSTWVRKPTRSSAGSAAASCRARASPSRCSGPPTCSCSTSRRSASTRCFAASCGPCSTAWRRPAPAVFVSSHVMDEADRCARLLMREGRVIADGTPERIREQTGTADIESAFLALVDGAADEGNPS